MKVWHNIYSKLITTENIFRCYREFKVGKKSKRDVIAFEKNSAVDLRVLHKSLLNKTYRAGLYVGFYIRDPKLRLIHKATVIDRIVHHIVSNQLEEIFEPTFYAHSYSCRKDKGTHKGVKAFQKMALSVGRNNTHPCWVLKCDIKKFFASVNHNVLFEILSKKISDKDFLDLLYKIINSFHSDRTTDINYKKGIPIGNLTSQFFANIYLNGFDQYLKHQLKIKHYIRYADDFVILSGSRKYLEDLIDPISKFLKTSLDLELHPNKITIKKFRAGIDFLGYIVFPNYILPRTKTKRRLIKKIREKVKLFKSGKITEEKLNQTIQSYLDYIGHANTYKFKQELLNLIWYWLTE